MTDTRRRAIERIREGLASAAGDVRVSQRRENFFFEDGLATEADISVRRAEEFLLVVVEDSVPRERQAVMGLWLRFAREVWVVDLRGRRIVRAVRGEVAREIGAGGKLQTDAVPGLQLDVAELFAWEMSGYPRPS
jgi:hypothetical protein